MVPLLKKIMDSLHKFDGLHFDEDCTQLKGHFENHLFSRCKFRDLSGLTLKNCVLRESMFEPQTLREAMGFTVSMECGTFYKAKPNRLMLEMLLMLVLQTEGNEELRQNIVDHVLGREKAHQLYELIRNLE